jgi:hypothetical protein
LRVGSPAQKREVADAMKFGIDHKLYNCLQEYILYI